MLATMLWAMAALSQSLAQGDIATAGQRSQLNPTSPYAYEYPFINLLKGSFGWSYGDRSGAPGPDEVDENGYLLHSAAAFLRHRAVGTSTLGPAQYARPGNYVLSWIGGGDFAIKQPRRNGGGEVIAVSCTGLNQSARGFGKCDNRSCSTFRGFIAGATLTVTSGPSGPGCSLTVGQPISGSGIKVSNFGTPTIITGLGTGRGGAGTYTVNFPQIVGSSSDPATIYPGGRFEFAVRGETTTNVTVWLFNLYASGTSNHQANTARHIAFVYTNRMRDANDDEAIYWSGEIFSPKFKQVLRQAGVGVLRDLGWANVNAANCTTWATRRPTAYYSYWAPEMRASLYAGIPNHSTSSVSFTGSISNGVLRAGNILDVTAVSSGAIRVGQYLDGNKGISSNTVIKAQISGTPGGIGKYLVSGAQYVSSVGMSVTSYDYSVNVGTHPPTDKETIMVRWGNDSPNPSTTTFSADNGVTIRPILNSGGFSNLKNSVPVKGYISTLIYDATLEGWLHWGGKIGAGGGSGSRQGLVCGVPPEVFIKLNAELGTSPWITEFYLAADPITDFYTEYATYIRNNYPNMVPQFETPNEIWNNRVDPSIYARAKTEAYARIDSSGAWRKATETSPFEDDWQGKVGSVLCQAISKVYQGDRTRYKCIVGVNTNGEYQAPERANPRLLSTAYTGQNTTDIPIQTGYTQTPAYEWATNIAVHTYWNVGEWSQRDYYEWQQETADAYRFFNGDLPQQAAIMSDYMATSLNPYVKNTIANNQRLWKFWYQWATTPPACPNSPCGVKGMVAYEGGYGVPLQAADTTINIVSATNANPCVLNTSVSFPGAFINDGRSRGNGIPGNELSIPKAPTGFVYLGATVTGAGVAPNTVIQGFKNARGRAGTYFVTPNQYVAPTTMTAATNGAVAGMPVTITAASGGSWPSVVGANLIVGTSPTNSTIPLKNTDGSDFDCSGLGTLTSMTLTYTGSANWISFLRKLSYTSPQLRKYTYDASAAFAAAGGSAPSQLTMANPITKGHSWGLISPDIYGYFSVATSTKSTISGTMLKLGGTITGRYQVGQTIIGRGVPANTTVVNILRGAGTKAGDAVQLSKSANVSTGTPIDGAIVGPFTSYNGVMDWNREH